VTLRGAAFSAAALAVLVVGACRLAAPPPSHAATGPVGWESFRRLDLLPLMRPGMQVRMTSSWDRTGGNDDGLSGRWSCLRRLPGRCVIAEHNGPGELVDMWFTRDRGDVRRTGRIRIELDGRVVLDAPLQSVVDGRLGAPFAFPLVANAAHSSGGVYIKVPMPFLSHMVVSTQENPRYDHVVYRTFADAAGVPTFDPGQGAGDVIARLRAAGLHDPKPPAAAPQTISGGGTVGPLRSATLLRAVGAGTATELRATVSSPAGVRARDEIVRRAHLLVHFDGARTVDAPVGQLFGSGLGPADVRSLLVAQRRAAPGSFVSWWPMPFREGMAVGLRNPTRQPARVSVRAIVDRGSPLPALLASRQAGRFHATSRFGVTPRGRPWPVLQARGRGVLVGLSATLVGPRSRPGHPTNHLEGDELIVADGGPALHGTGTEDFFEAGWYWNRGAHTLPFTGAPVRRVASGGCADDCTAAYRLLVSDAIPFSSSLRFDLEHGPRNTVGGTYGTTAYWYG
jgi:hypothetical protein